MSIQPLILKNGILTFPRSPTDTASLVASLNLSKVSVGLSNVDNTSDLSKPISTLTQSALDLKANIASPNFTGTPTAQTATAGTNTGQLATTAFVTTAVSAISTSSFVDLTTNQTINGIKIFNGSLQLPNNSGASAGTIWRSGNNLEYKDGANVTKVLLNSAGNLSNLMDKQVSLNNLVGTQTANRVLRSDGTNVTLSQVNLASDITGVLSISNGGTGSSTQNFVDLTTNQSVGGIKTFSGGLLLPSTSGASIGAIWRNLDNLEYKDSNNITKVILNSAGNLSNLANKQTSLNNLVGTQTTNRVLRSDGTNVTLSQVALDTDVINVLPLANGGTGSNIKNFVDLTTAQTVAGTKTFTNTAQIQSAFPGFWLDETDHTVKGAYIVLDGGNLQIQRRSANFGAFEATLAGINVTSGIVSFSGGVASTSTTTGTVIVTGGIGASNGLYAAGGINFSLPTSSTGLPAGSLWRNGNVVNIV